MSRRTEKRKYGKYNKFDVVYADFGKNPHGIQGGIRPGIIISCDASNHDGAPQVSVVPLDYVLVGDYYLPVLSLPEETRPIGCWGMLRKEYLKEHKSGMYSCLLLTARLDSHLADVNEQAQERFELIEAQMRSAEGVTEDLKAQNPMEWVRRANNIRNRAQEIVLNELVYV